MDPRHRLARFLQALHAPPREDQCVPILHQAGLAGTHPPSNRDRWLPERRHRGSNRSMRDSLLHSNGIRLNSKLNRYNAAAFRRSIAKNQHFITCTKICCESHNLLSFKPKTRHPNLANQPHSWPAAKRSPDCLEIKRHLAFAIHLPLDALPHIHETEPSCLDTRP